MVVKWKKQLLDSSSKLFASGKGLAPDRESEIKALQSKIGEITMANDFYPKRLLGRREGAQNMINQNRNLSIVRQCNALELARSDCYCTPKPGSDADLKLMRLID